MELIEPKTGEERYWPVESREELVAVFQTVPEALEWCRKDADNQEALLDVVRAVEGEDGGVAGLERMFREAGGVGTEEFAEAVCRVLVEGPGVSQGIAERWRKEREAKEEERWREEEKRLRKAEEEQRRREEESRRQAEELVRREREEEEKEKREWGRAIAEADENMALMDTHLGAL